MNRIATFASILALAFGFSLATPEISRAEYFDGNDLYKECIEPRSSSTYYQSNANCRSYILGIHDAHEFQALIEADAGEAAETYFCVPEGVTAGQLTEIVTNYLRNNPQNRHEPAAGLVILALIYTYPCR